MLGFKEFIKERWGDKKRNPVAKNIFKFNKPKKFRDKRKEQKRGEVKHKRDIIGE